MAGNNSIRKSTEFEQLYDHYIVSLFWKTMESKTKSLDLIFSGKVKADWSSWKKKMNEKSCFNHFICFSLRFNEFTIKDQKQAVTRRYVCQFNSKLHTEPKSLNTMEVSQSRNLVQSMMTNLGEVKMKGPMTSNGKSRSALNSKWSSFR